MKKEIPILFSTPMVQAILEGRKTMTRRIITPKPDPVSEGPSYMPVAPCLDWESIYNEDWKPWYWDTEEGERITKHCPYGEPGDPLWVRESFGKVALFGQPFDYVYKASTEFIGGKWYYTFPNGGTHQRHEMNGKWKPSIHMPKPAARIWLEVTNIRVERLQGISPGDADLEGVERWNEDYHTEPGALHADYGNYLWKDDPKHQEYWFPSFPNPIDSFRSLWIKINGSDSWNQNPWVWVVAFKVLSKTGQPIEKATSYNFTNHNNLETSHY